MFIAILKKLHKLNTYAIVGTYCIYYIHNRNHNIIFYTLNFDHTENESKCQQCYGMVRLCYILYSHSILLLACSLEYDVMYKLTDNGHLERADLGDFVVLVVGGRHRLLWLLLLTVRR